MRIRVERFHDHPLNIGTPGGGTSVIVSHSLQDGGVVSSRWSTNQVLFINIHGFGLLEIDLTREDASRRVVVHTVGDEEDDRCVVCRILIHPEDGGLCDKHRYNEQRR